MAAARPCAASLCRRIAVRSPSTHLRPLYPSSSQLQQPRTYATAKPAPSANAAKFRALNKNKTKKKKKANPSYVMSDLSHAEQFSLLDAMRYIRAFEVGYKPTSSKYELHVRLRTLKNGPVVRNRFRLPHPVDNSLRICVVCPPDSRHARAAKAAGAALVGEENVFEEIRAGRIEFERCIAHQDSLTKLNAAGLGRVLGPKGLMPSARLGTVVKDVEKAVKDMLGGSEYRERNGVVRMAVGQLAFSPDEMQRNLRAFMDVVKRDISALADRATKEVHEVVLSSTNAPGFSLNGDFRSPTSPSPQALSTS